MQTDPSIDPSIHHPPPPRPPEVYMRCSHQSNLTAAPSFQGAPEGGMRFHAHHWMLSYISPHNPPALDRRTPINSRSEEFHRPIFTRYSKWRSGYSHKCFMINKLLPAGNNKARGGTTLIFSNSESASQQRYPSSPSNTIHRSASRPTKIQPKQQDMTPTPRSTPLANLHNPVLRSKRQRRNPPDCTFELGVYVHTR